MVYFIGAGPGDPDLITVKGQRLIEQADTIIYAGSLVNPDLLAGARFNAKIYDSSKMSLPEIISAMKKTEPGITVRLHTGDPCLYGAIREQMDLLESAGISYDSTPGVSAFSGAAAALNMEYTLPGISQSVVITRIAGRTPVPERESIESFAAHGATMVIFLSAGHLEELSRRLIDGGYAPDTPAAIVYKASWPDEKTLSCTVGTLAETAKAHDIARLALIIVGDAVAQVGDTQVGYERSKLYDPAFTTGYRKGK